MQLPQQLANSASPLEKETPGAPVATLNGVGITTEKNLARIGIHTIEDLLLHLPVRYRDKTKLTPLSALQIDAVCLVEGVIEKSYRQFPKKRSSFVVVITDGWTRLLLRFFHFSDYQRKQLAVGYQLRCFGRIRNGRHGAEMIHPEYQRLAREAAPPPTATTLTPVYPLTAGLTQKRLIHLIRQALDRFLSCPELLPVGMAQKNNLPGFNAAIRYLHAPPADAPLDVLQSGRDHMQRRLIFEELLAHQLVAKLARRMTKQYTAPILSATKTPLQKKFRRALPFKLTKAQQCVIEKLQQELAVSQPMLRLLQGEVGSGKTVVAACAALQTIASGYQAALMVPTEILAEQHMRVFSNWFSPLGIETVLLCSSLSKRAKQIALARIAKEKRLCIIGTQALFQENVHYAALGLALFDEQHRFGVHQRCALRDKGTTAETMPHQLVISATPIPRTLAMMLYADLDILLLDELPSNRKPIQTTVLPNNRRADIIRRIEIICGKGQQVFWVCPLIDPSEKIPCQAAIETHAKLCAALGDKISIGLVHGQMHQNDKTKIMHAFRDNRISLLVATSVIEVGVDIPNATVMIIENTERLGLSQLHQLRGRVGRGAVQGHCLLLYQPPLGALAKERLQIIRSTNDGFLLAQKDLELRGPGEIHGTKQTGVPEMRIANAGRDAALLAVVSTAANEMLEQDCRTIPLLIERWFQQDLMCDVV